MLAKTGALEQRQFAEQYQQPYVLSREQTVTLRRAEQLEMREQREGASAPLEMFGLKEPYAPGQREREMGGVWGRLTSTSAPPALFAEYMKAKEMEKTVTEQFWEFMTEPRITRYEGYGEREVLGSPVGGGVVARTMTHFVKTGEATVGEFEEHILKQPTIRSDLMSPEELAVTYGIIGTVALVKFGPKITKWFSGTRVGETIKFSRAAKTFETIKLTIKTKLPSWKGSRLDVWLAKKSKLYYSKTSGIARGEVAQKVLPPKVSLGSELEWSERYWKMIQAPRTGGVMIGKSPLTTKGLQTYTFEWILKGGQLVPRFRPQRIEEVGAIRAKDWQKYWQPERGLTPFVSLTQLTRLDIIPYRAPYVGGRATAIISPQVIGSMLAVLGVGLTKKLRFKPKFQPLEWQPTLAREREKFRTLTLQLQKQKQKQKQLLVFPKLQKLQLKHQPLRQIYRPKLKERQALPLPYLTVPRAVAKQEQKIVVTPKQIQTPKQDFPPIIPTIPTPTPPIIPPFRTPIGGADVSRGAKGLFGKWFKRTHPIKSAREMWETFSGKKRKRVKGGVSLRF